MKIGSKMWSLECSQGFPPIWAGDLIFDPMWPILKHIKQIIPNNIMNKFQQRLGQTCYLLCLYLVLHFKQVS